MKSTDNFKKVIQAHLESYAKQDELFAQKYSDPSKNIDDCITYILNTVKDSGCNGFEDDEVYGMAIHYYDEKDIKVGNKIDAKVIINEEIKISPQEIAEAKRNALEEVARLAVKKLTPVKDKLSKHKSKPKPEVKKDDVQPTLF